MPRHTLRGGGLPQSTESPHKLPSLTYLVPLPILKWSSEDKTLVAKTAVWFSQNLFQVKVIRSVVNDCSLPEVE